MEIKRGDASYRIEAHEHKLYWSAIAQNNWEEDTFQVIDAFTKENSHLLDIGAWAGPISLYAACRCKKVYAFEPDPAIFPQLEQNIALNPRLQSKINCYPWALAENSGSQKLYARNKYGDSSTSLLARSNDKLSTKKCKTISLDDLILELNDPKIDFIKMDIEGGEFQVIPHLKSGLKKLNYPSLLISFHYTHLLEFLLKQKHDYAFLNKILIKLDKLKIFTLYHSQIHSYLSDCINALNFYSYLYTSKGDEISAEEILNNPRRILSESYLFTNQKWPKNAEAN